MLRIWRPLCQNFKKFNYLIPLATITNQFKITKPIFYPNRKQEVQQNGNDDCTALVGKVNMIIQKSYPKENCYKILGIQETASKQQVDLAYLTLATNLHPEAIKNEESLKKLQKITIAYYILMNKTKLSELLNLGMIKDMNKFLKMVKINMNELAMKTNDIRSKLICCGNLTSSTQNDPTLELTFLEAANGVSKKIDLQYLKKCPDCGGRSPKFRNRQPDPCRRCLGKGELIKSMFSASSPQICDKCQGKGYIDRNYCDGCKSSGLVVDKVRVNVPLKSGVQSGEIIEVENPITMKITNYRIQVLENDYYRRIGNDIHTEKYITISDAILGGVFKIRGLYGPIEIKTEPGTESHSQIVIQGKGIRTPTAVGNHVVTIKIRIPQHLSMKQRQLIQALAKAEEPNFERAF